MSASVESLSLAYSKGSKIVIEIGTRFTKFGHAGESSPRAIVRNTSLLTSILCTSRNSTFQQQDQSAEVPPATAQEIRSEFYKLFHAAFFRYLQIDPEGTTALIVRDLYSACETILQEHIEHILLQRFKVTKVEFLTSQYVSLFASDNLSGLVIDVGFSETRIVPICFGHQIMTAVTTIPLGSDFLMREMRSLILSNNTNVKKVDDDTLEDVLARVCYCIDTVNPVKSATPTTSQGASATQAISGLLSPRAESEKLKMAFTQFKKERTIPYQNGNDTLEFSENMRWETTELLFKGHPEGFSISESVLETLLKCEPDVRRQVCANVIICGGTSMIVGFKRKLLIEMDHLCQTIERYQPLKGSMQKIRLLKPQAPANTIAWAGASIFGTLINN